MFVLYIFKMDSLTQIVLGAAVANAIAGNKLKNRALLYGAIAGTIPDLDVIAGMFLDPLDALEIHRGMTHSVFFAFFLALVLGALVARWERSRGLTFKEGFWMFFLGLFTHALLDVFTTWGTRILWPYSYPFAFKSIFVVDPLYTVPFIVFLSLSAFETQDLIKRRYWNRLGLWFSTSYLILTLGLKWFAYQQFVSDLKDQSFVYEQLSVKPTALNTILWQAIVETDEAYLIGDYSFFDVSPISFQSYPKQHGLLGDWRTEPVVGRLITIAEGWYVITEQDGELYFNDLRFGLLKKEASSVQFAFSYRLYRDAAGVLQAEEVYKERKDGLKLLSTLWYRLQGR